MDFVTNTKSNTHIFDSVPLDDVLAFYSNPFAYPELKDKIFSDYVANPKYFDACVTHAKYTSLIENEFKIYYKLTEYNFESRGFKYKLGLNMDTKPFNPSGCCSGGGLYFCELENLHQFESYGNYLTPIVVPHSIPVYKETHSMSCSHRANTYEKLKAPCIYVLPRMRIDNPAVNKFICQASPLNNTFINCMLYKSENIQDLKDFASYANTKYFWSREKEYVWTKITIHSYLESPKQNFHMLSRIFYNGLLFDKQVINFLIEHAMPQLIEHYIYKIEPTNSLKLDPSEYSKWFTNEEKQIFSSSNIIVAGSSVLRYITNRNFKPNDIDLYISASNLEKLENSKIFSLDDCDSEEIKSHYNMKNIISVKNIRIQIKTFDQYGYDKICTKKYQLIVLDSDPVEFIKNNFDFDLCAIGYSFASNSFVNHIEKPDYSVLTIQPSYINKMCGTDTDAMSEYRARRTFGRIEKYITRGFYVENWKEFLEAIRDSMCK
jgi:hypothetical protein